MRTAIAATLLVFGVSMAALAAEPKATTQTPALQTPPNSEVAGGPMLRRVYQLTKTARYSADYTKIIEDCQQALQVGVNGPDVAYAESLMSWAYNRRGEINATAGRDTEALSDFSSAVTLDEKNWRALHNRGVSHAQAGSLQEAMTDFNAALELNKSYPNSWYNRGELKYQQGDFEAAIQDYNEAIRIVPRDGSYLNSRGHAEYRLGHVKEAQRDFAAAVELAPGNASAWVNLGDFHTNQGNYAEATKEYRQAIQVNPRFGRAYQSSAWLLATCPDE
ncbi:MAG TPA: tetratricopeptide repeat protein, partial [Pirellulales bacterium]|nr:tetratricopeptide repeat protein [Pirellulales bacterium]